MRLLGGIRSRYGTFSITGNHDTGNYVRDTLSLPPATNIAALVERQRAMGGAYSTTKRSTCGAATILSPCRVSPTTARWPVSATIGRCPATISARPTATCRKNSTSRRRHSATLGTDSRCGLRRPDTFGARSQHAVQNTALRPRLLARATDVQPLERPLREAGEDALCQRRHRICRISHADRCESRNNPVRITTMNVYASVALSGDGYVGRSVAPATDSLNARRLARGDAPARGPTRSSWGRRPCAATTRRSPCATKRSAGSALRKPAGRPREGHTEPFAATRPRVELLHRRLGRTDRLHRQRCRIAARNSGRNRPYPRPFGWRGSSPNWKSGASNGCSSREARAHSAFFLRRGSSRHAPHGRQSRRPRRRPACPLFSNRLSIRHASRSSADGWKEWR